MKKVFYLILIGIMFVIPKNVFASDYTFDTIIVNNLHFDNYQEWKTNSFYTNFFFDNNSWHYFSTYHHVGLVMHINGTFSNSTTYVFTSSFCLSDNLSYLDEYYIGNNIRKYQKTSEICQLTTEYGSTYGHVYDFYFEHKSSNPNENGTYSIFDLNYNFSVSSANFGLQGYSYKLMTKEEYLSENSSQLNEQVKTNEKLDEANETSKGIWGTIKEVLSNIISLPMKLVELLIDALKSLFVPTDEQLYEIINDSKELSENFGFVGESINFFINIFTSLLGMVNANGCIELPEFTIGKTSLFDSFTFWKAQNVCLNDNVILSNNINTIRTITSIVLVGLFINFASKQFFNILSKNESQNDQAQEILDRYK